LFRHFLIALQFLTIVRLRNDLAETEADLAASVGYYPLVGLVLGLVLTGIFFILRSFLPTPIVGLLLVAAQAVLTGGLHLDGLADTADGLFSHRHRSRKLAIMKDSAVGVFGVLALFFVLTLKFLLLSNLNSPAAWTGLILFPIWGRWAVSLTACLSEYARAEGGLGRPFIDLAGPKELYLAGGATMGLSLLFLSLAGLIVALVIALAAGLGVLFWRKQLGGVTGDVLGATVELSETLGLLLWTGFHEF